MGFHGFRTQKEFAGHFQVGIAMNQEFEHLTSRSLRGLFGSAAAAGVPPF